MVRFSGLTGLCFFLLLMAGGGQLSAQHASVERQQENDQPDIYINSPTRAAMLSATLPGLGQIYNRKYWKVPIIYAGFGTLAYFVGFNQGEYSKWREAWIARVDGNPNTIDDYPLYSDDALERAMNYYRRNLEITYVLTAALYLLNILDASVDAHLMHFDVGEDLSVGLPVGAYERSTHHMPVQNTLFTLRFRF